MNRRSVSQCCIAGLLASTAAAAQGNIGSLSTTTPKGMARVLAAGVSFAEPIGSPDPIRMKAPNHQTVTPEVFTAAAFPLLNDHSVAAMFPNVSPALLGFLHFDAIATDNLIPNVTATGEFVLTSAWASINLSVTSSTAGNRDSNGNPVNVIGVRHDKPNINSGSDIYGHYFGGSQTIASNLLNETLLEIGEKKLRANGNEVDALDFGLGVMGHRQGVPSSMIFTGNKDVFVFSVTSNTADNLGTLPGLAVPLHPGSIYRIEFTNGAWSAPTELFTLKQFDTPGGDRYDIDAVSYCEQRNILVFSTSLDTNLPQRPQIEVIDLDWQSQVPVELKTQNNTSIMAALDLDGDPSADPDAICIIDPETAPGAIDSAMGTASDWQCSTSVYGTPVTLRTKKTSPNVSMTFSGSVATGDRVLHLEVSGGVPLQPLFSMVSFDFDPNLGPTNGTWGSPTFIGSFDSTGAFNLSLPLGDLAPNSTLALPMSLGFITVSLDTDLMITNCCSIDAAR